MKQNHLQVLKVVSPAFAAGEAKNQDRAEWFSSQNVATVCDGVSTSPYSQKAAELVSILSPELHDKDPDSGIRCIARALINCRQLAREKGLLINNGYPKAMQAYLREVGNDSLNHSYQTTIVTAKFTFEKNCIHAFVLSCGDSAFFAFLPTGECLYSSLTDRNPDLNKNIKGNIQLGHGDEILVKVLGNLKHYRKYYDPSTPINPDSYYVCKALDKVHNRICDNPLLVLQTDDIIIVPKFLIAHSKDSDLCEFKRVIYSKHIRQTKEEKSVALPYFGGLGSTTHVLPDHADSPYWLNNQDKFPNDTLFVLCSDGFYESLPEPKHMCNWLRQYATATKERKSLLLESLHQKLTDTIGNDDISFIYLHSAIP